MESNVNYQAQPGQVAVPVGRKDDQEKPRFELLDPEFLEGVARVLTFGARKYAAHNWRGGIAYSRLLGATLRHVNAINAGEDRDPETGLDHELHAACELMFLYWMKKHRKDMDDRFKSHSYKPVPIDNNQFPIGEWNPQNLDRVGVMEVLASGFSLDRDSPSVVLDRKERSSRVVDKSECTPRLAPCRAHGEAMGDSDA